MKKIKIYLSFLAVFALLFTSCSKDEEAGINPDSEKASLSFGAIVQDLANKSGNKQSDSNDLPACSDDTAAYVEIVLSRDGTNVVGSDSEPFRVDLVEGQVFTKEVPELELEPGNYSLEHFAVYNSEGDPIWLAPKNGSDYAEFVDNPLPLDISLGAGVKKYVDVSVLCFDDRDVNLYGYLFFQINEKKAFEYCFFANYCTPEGRHWPAHFSVEISIDGNVLYSADENMNNVGKNGDGDFFADPICFALPDLDDYADDEEYIDYVLTLQDWDGAYGDVEQIVIQGSLSRDEVVANFDGDSNVYYDHQRFGCGEDQPPMDSDGDGVDDSIDQCPGTEDGVEVDATGCPVNQGTDTDGDGIPDSSDNCVNTSNPDQTDTDSDGMGDACDPDDDNDGVNDDIDTCPLEEGPANNDGCPVQETDTDGDGIPDSSDNCVNTSNPDQTDTDNDGIGDACDDCINEAGPANNNGCPVAECVIDALDNTETCARGITPPSSSPDYANVGDFIEIGGDSATPILEDTGSSFGPSIGTVGVVLSGSSLSLSLDPISTLYFTDYKIEVRDSQGGATTCITGVDLSEVNNGDAVDYDINVDGSFTYPIYIRVVSNECPVTP